MERVSFIKKYIAIFAIAIIAITVVSIMVKYSVEGESNMPFEISKVMVISTAGGVQKEGSESKWDLNLLQNNDVYIDIIKNKNYKEEEIIDKIVIDNFTIEDTPIKGQIQLYRANNESGIFNNKEEYKIENEVTYIGSEASNLENLQIANQGGLILLRVVNEGIASYISNEEQEVRHDGTLLGKAGVTNEDIKFRVKFDVSIELKSEKKYKASIELEMPMGNLTEAGTTNYQVSSDKIVFKRY